MTLLSRRDRGSARTLDIAAQIAAFHRGRLTVTRTTQLTGSEDFDAWVSGLLEGHSVSLQIEPAAIEPDSLRQRIIELDCRLLVLEASEQDDVRALVEHLGCDVVVIRH